MAEIIPPLNNQRTLSRMTSGEKRVAQRLRDLLEDDYLVWYDIPVGRQRRYPDFIVLHPARGLLFLEVKDWKPETLKKVSKSEVTLLTSQGLVTRPHPLEQVRQYTYAVIDQLARDPVLQQKNAAHRGRLIIPWGWGVVFTHIRRRQIEQAMPEEARERLLPDHLVMYREDVSSSVDVEAFQERLWGMFQYQFGSCLTLPQIDRIRWHLFPEIRIDGSPTGDLFALNEGEDDAGESTTTIPDIVRVMDLQQEQLARSLGEGHRVIHGVAGSGKTLILGYRCLHLAEITDRPILVLCFNVSLAARLRAFISARGIGSQVQIYHFHDWCAQQIRTYHVELVESDRPVWERQVETVIQGVEAGWIPRAQYAAVLIDEGHDFAAEWLQLVTQMIDPETNSLLLLYDDAQSIYRKGKGLGFSLASVGIQAQGRTTILRVNYRNTREILAFAYAFMRQYMDEGKSAAGVELIEPEACGVSGPVPVLKRLASADEEVAYALACIRKWRGDGVALRDIAVLCASGQLSRAVTSALREEGIDCLWLGDRRHKAAYDPGQDRVTVSSIYSSKGLEFDRVILLGTGELGQAEDNQEDQARLLYVAMTRARECLLMIASIRSPFVEQLQSLADQPPG
ncbi:MAG: DNA helicase II [Gammaproteobacteria bacterium]|nr:MAG: DNA helicase II [Gammaproteobacteria bacterium]